MWSHFSAVPHTSIDQERGRLRQFLCRGHRLQSVALSIRDRPIAGPLSDPLLQDDDLLQNFKQKGMSSADSYSRKGTVGIKSTFSHPIRGKKPLTPTYSVNIDSNNCPIRNLFRWICRIGRSNRRKNGDFLFRKVNDKFAFLLKPTIGLYPETALTHRMKPNGGLTIQCYCSCQTLS